MNSSLKFTSNPFCLMNFKIVHFNDQTLAQIKKGEINEGNFKQLQLPLLKFNQ